MHEGQGGGSAVIAPEVHLETRLEVAGTGPLLEPSGGIGSPPGNHLTIVDPLQVGPGRQSHLGINPSNHQFSAGAVAVGRNRSEGRLGHLELELNMPGVDRIGAFRLVRPIGTQGAHCFARYRIEEPILLGRYRV
ncbi:MAG: hypothetical protein NTY84_12055 [Verrucomicrobia bacterium]|nr:hypothetical protein [Verrucomicrobiota bacterium]